MSFGNNLLKSVAGVVAPGPIIGIEVLKATVKYVNKKIDNYGREKFEQGVNIGVEKGNIETKKKLAEKKEHEDDVRAAALALAVYVANLDGKINEDEIAAIEAELAGPDSRFNTDNLKIKFAKVLNEINSGMNFYSLQNIYLDKLNSEELMLINDLIFDVIKADDEISQAEMTFWNSEWYHYLQKKGIEIKKILLNDTNSNILEKTVELHEQNNITNEAFKKLIKNAENGDVVAMFNLGQVFEHGRMEKKVDYYAARNWYRKAAKNGFISAQYKLEDIERKIKKEERREDILKRFEVDKEAAERLYNEAWRYEHGIDVPEDLDRAKELYRISALKGNQNAKSRLNFLTRIS
ncbi:MAG: TerB family tellurite resistance protein [Succiniclasticum sp.]|uniref:TerB family tellurite resistance protein n=1 Tax=Succiniclasticum sp. TaxID=2775030 RepID=UPI002A9182D3|nr:TerB family tellurite resistance protein [Succiniclasticum sp.]MDY6290830.1 TerB family tellurite resistance protein [Succiniclasticum sp.]